MPGITEATHEYNGQLFRVETHEAANFAEPLTTYS